jgi:hypothetical protein
MSVVAITRKIPQAGMDLLRQAEDACEYAMSRDGIL